jgi:carbon-monoxide dehydrogenase medium subunit
VLVAALGSVVARSASGTREIAAADLFTGFLDTTLAPDELLVEIRFPAVGLRHGAAFCEWAPRAGDFAVAGIALTIERADDGSCIALGAAACGVGSVPVDCSSFLASVIGAAEVTGTMLRSVARTVRTGIRGDADRADLLGLLAARAVARAFERSARAGDGEVAA